MITRQRSWSAPVGLIALSLIPVMAGALRLVQLSGGPELVPADPRFAPAPLPVVVHIVGAAVYTLLGAFQFVPAIRRRHIGYHRATGRILVIAGLAVAVSALWMTLLFPWKEGTGPLLFVMRLVFGSLMVTCLVLGFSAVPRRDITTHRAWMIRAYALGLAAGTQAITEGFGGALFGTGVLRNDLYKTAGWVINLAVAELIIRRPGPRP